uniref:Uncharacterized protein n=1 Tax=Cucumis melo TaxID=3656 RepID=A0A9I9E8Z1_CUCME
MYETHFPTLIISCIYTPPFFTSPKLNRVPISCNQPNRECFRLYLVKSVESVLPTKLDTTEKESRVSTPRHS